jgi:predicted nuclease of predicted toxin-antitoxin system
VRILADESVDHPIVERLRAEGHEVESVAEASAGLPDEAVLARANELGALLISADKDFGDLHYRRGMAHGGIVLLRLTGMSNLRKAELVAEVFRSRGRELARAFCVITPSMIRLRRASEP